ncbi:MAG: serine hydroxymethyltransferase [Bacilli bacterium]|nr:serine hydroxymethyltransferase [Bacilli bacterium]
MIDNESLKKEDPEIYEAIKNETQRQQDNVELIASENFVSEAVREAQGSLMTNKYAEGYPGKRYYGGCTYVDIAENLAIERVKKLFHAKYANVQPHSGSQANMAAIRSLIKPKDKILGMSLNSGGHLTHGYTLSFSGKDYQSFTYDVDEKTGLIDYEKVREIALIVRPNLIIAGASAYPREIDFTKFRDIADEVGAYLMVDMAHIAGLVAAGLHQNPVPIADVVTSTTHKTLRGPRGGLILSNNLELGNRINRCVFPETQGGPLEHVIAAKAVCFKEALQPSFIEYQYQVVKNAKALAQKLASLGIKIISGGTDNHLLLADVKNSLGITGLEAQQILEKINITCNKNSIPGDKERPKYCSGIRLGTPAMTTRGYKEQDFERVGEIINQALRNKDDENVLRELKRQIGILNKNHPLPSK